jgi:aryl-alcohol dehydrogenase-like predicted oxidoreductase
VDILYLHNVAESSMDGPKDEAFLRKLKEAFAWLEKARDEGKIAAYGMVSPQSDLCGYPLGCILSRVAMSVDIL